MRSLFISDLHLCEQRPDITRALLHFLSEQAKDCDRLYLLGDIFEAWIGDDAIPAWLKPVCSSLKQLSDNGIKLYFQHGNRDFLVGNSFADMIGAEILPEISCVTLPDNSQAVVLHGDQLCLEDIAYQEFRRMVRDGAWQAAFLSKSIEERLAIARQLREKSKEQGAVKSDAIMDVTPQAVRDTLESEGMELMIHGHTHRPAVHQLTLSTGTGTRIVLGDWDRSGWYLDCTESGCNLTDFPISN